MDKNESLNFELSCPIPISQYERVLLAHGGGGKLSNQLIQERQYLQVLNSRKET